jgi:peroxiredoxin
VALALTGCAEEEQADLGPGGAVATQPGDTGSSPSATTQTAQPELPEPQEPAPPPPPTIPEVHLTDAQQEASVVGVGQSLPEGQLPNLEGQDQAIHDLLGKNLTVLFFWKAGSSTAEQLRATAALEDLQNDIVAAFGEQGVQVVGVNVGGPADAVRQQVEEAKAQFPVLIDEQGSYFAQVAKDIVPRVYLLDKDRKILWLDLEWSSASRRNLTQAIEAALREAGMAAEATPPQE